ncbi:MAG TPA: hypothetical protein VMS73_01360 [Anaerolineaceae bacterium]|nr:hypothetical protein [Anaerolineaceae bacterium]
MGTKSSSLSSTRYGIIIITVITALVHLYLAITSNPFDIVFFLNFLGYLALLAAYILPIPILKDYKGLVRWVFMAFVVVTIIAWILVGLRVWFAYIDKILEVALVVLLWFDKP